LPAFRPDLKAVVEGRFELIDAASIKWVAGATHGRSRGDPDDRPHEEDGLLDLDAFRKFMIYAICKYNNTHKVRHPPSWYMSADAKSPTPIEVWNYGCVHLGTPAVVDPRLLRAQLLHVHRAKMTDEGLKVGRLFYAPVNSEDRSQFDRIRHRKWQEVDIRHDPRDVSSILVPRKSSDFAIYRLTPKYRRYDGWTLDEVSEFLALRVASDNLAEQERLDHEATFRARVGSLDKTARVTAAQARVQSDKAPRRGRRIGLSGDKDLRSQERQERRSEEAFTKTADRRQRATAPATACSDQAAHTTGGTSKTLPLPGPLRSFKPNKVAKLNEARVAALAREEIGK
jgi:hypothetical protein